MQGGDISNEVPPRAIFVFEGLIAYPPTSKLPLATTVAARLHRWDRVLNAWTLNETMVKQMWDHAWRRGIQFDVVTFLYEESFAVALWHRLDNLGLPMSRVLWYPSLQHLAEGLAYMPDVYVVYAGTWSASLAFGKKGYHVVDPTRLL